MERLWPPARTSGYCYIKEQMQSIPNKLESAIAELIRAAGVSVPVRRDGATEQVELSVFTGLEDEEQAVPCATAIALSGQEFPQGSGNFTFAVTVEVRSNAAETDLTAHRQLCEEALLPLNQDDTDQQINAKAAENSDAMGVIGISNRASRERVEDKQWVTEFTFDAYCCALTLT